MTTGVITYWLPHVTSLTTPVSTMGFLIEVIFILKVIKSHLKRMYDKLNLTLVVISCEIYETCQRLIPKISISIKSTLIRSSIFEMQIKRILCEGSFYIFLS